MLGLLVFVFFRPETILNATGVISHLFHVYQVMVALNMTHEQFFSILLLVIAFFLHVLRNRPNYNTHSKLSQIAQSSH
jgi:hypothetical protein